MSSTGVLKHPRPLPAPTCPPPQQTLPRGVRSRNLAHQGWGTASPACCVAPGLSLTPAEGCHSGILTLTLGRTPNAACAVGAELCVIYDLEFGYRGQNEKIVRVSRVINGEKNM
jgi:hypothetical protein